MSALQPRIEQLTRPPESNLDNKNPALFSDQQPLPVNINNIRPADPHHIVYEAVPDNNVQHWLANHYDSDRMSVASSELLGSPLLPTTQPPGAGHSSQPWYHGQIKREQANTLLGMHGLTDGLFLVRGSSNSAADYVLSMSHDKQVKHFQITKRGGRPPWYAIEDGPAFPDLCKLVEHYSNAADRLPAKLSCYCIKQ